MYYRAKDLALSNGRTYHIAAILRRNGRIVKVGENTNKTHPRFKRQYADGSWASHMHAEMNVLRFAKPGDEIEVLRKVIKQINLTEHSATNEIFSTYPDLNFSKVISIKNT